MVTGIATVKGNEVEPCDACQLDKLTRPPHPQRPFMHNTTLPLQLVVMGPAGPVRPKTTGARAYILNMFDVYIRFSWTIMLKIKDEALIKIVEWLPVAKSQAGTRCQVLISDNGGGFT